MSFDVDAPNPKNGVGGAQADSEELIKKVVSGGPFSVAKFTRVTTTSIYNTKAIDGEIGYDQGVASGALFRPIDRLTACLNSVCSFLPCFSSHPAASNARVKYQQLSSREANPGFVV